MNIYQNYISTLKSLSYYAYPFPTGKLYIFADNTSIKLIQFGYGLDKNILTKNTEGMTKPLEIAIDFLDNYLLGKTGEYPQFDFSPFTQNEIRVYKELLKVPFGSVISYSALAKKAKIKDGGRFAGNCMAKNIFPVLVPCHRVIKADGSMGNYSGGVRIKEFLLQHERVMK